MGYGEFGGTGSVGWRVVHTDKGERGTGWDPVRHQGEAKFIIMVDDKVIATPYITQRIKVIWPPHDEETAV